MLTYRTSAALVSLSALIVSLTACSSKADTEDLTEAAADTASIETIPLSAAGREFFTATFEMGLLEIEAAKLAGEKSESLPVREFAELMLQSYSRTNDSIRQIALSNHFELPQQPDGKGRELLEKLAKLEGPEFDRLYSTEMREAHKQAVQSFAMLAQTSPDPIVHTFAQTQLPATRDRFRIAQSLPGNIG